MKLTGNVTRNGVFILIIVLMSSTILLSQQKETDALKQMEAEMIETFGMVPAHFKALPENLRVAAWEMMKARQSPDMVIPPKYSELIGLGVASQIPCDYCVFFHTEMAKFFGASERELQEAVSSAADTRFWSTIINGANISYETIKSQTNQSLEHIKTHSK